MSELKTSHIILLSNNSTIVYDTLYLRFLLWDDIFTIYGSAE